MFGNMPFIAEDSILIKNLHPLIEENPDDILGHMVGQIASEEVIQLILSKCMHILTGSVAEGGVDVA